MPDRSTSLRRDLAIGLPVAAVAGLLVGALGTFKQQFGVSVATGSGFPVGLTLALAMVAVFLVALRLGFPSRWYAVAAAVGILAAVAVLWQTGPGGSVVLLPDLPAHVVNLGQVWTVGCVLIAAVVAGLPRLRGRPATGAAADGILADVPSVHDPLGENRP